MIWLKKIDFISQFVGQGFLDKIAAAGGKLFNGLPGQLGDKSKPVIIRPGGLGDMVLLTEACRQLRIPLNSFIWVCESRNACWLEWIGGTEVRAYLSKWSLRNLSSRVKVVNTEQLHGLASVYGRALLEKEGSQVGFERNPRADLFQDNVKYQEDEHELFSFKNILKSTVPELIGKEVESEAYPVKKKGFVVLALAGLNQPEKKLALSEWIQIADTAIQEARERSCSEVRLVGVKEDSSFSSELVASIKGRDTIKVSNLVGKLGFKDLVPIIREANHLVSIDSGLVHVADYFQTTSTVYFFRGFPKKWGPRTDGSTVIDRRLSSQL